jgi:glycerol-3-phosphate dehydrogenase
MEPVRLNAVVFGGGAAGLWILDELARRGRSAVLLESSTLGDGQTIVSQGIIHSGLKYSLQGILTNAAREARDTIVTWRECFRGTGRPDLSGVEIRSECCYLWGTQSASSRIGMLGARIGLRSTPQLVPVEERPAALRTCFGSVYRIDEQVLAPRSLLGALAEPHRAAILRYGSPDHAAFDCPSPGAVRQLRLTADDGGAPVVLAPDFVIFAAGKGNAELRSRVGLDPTSMQLRPLHVALMRGAHLPEFHGHCIDGAKTRVTITSARDAKGTMVWQVAGNLAEDAVPLERDALIRWAQQEVAATLPAVELRGTEWTTFRVDRAEGSTKAGARPDSYVLLREGNVLTTWPTKLVLVPPLAVAVGNLVSQSPALPSPAASLWQAWSPAAPAATWWDRPQTWTPYADDVVAGSGAER